LKAASRPIRIEAIIPDAPQRSATSDTSPIAERGDAICSIVLSTSSWPDSETGRTSSSSVITLALSSSSCRTRPKIETSRMVSGKSEKRTRKAIAAAYCGQRSLKRSSSARGNARASPRTMS
jgi:hypothetical protein